jgi:hypothetical protein
MGLELATLRITVGHKSLRDTESQNHTDAAKPPGERERDALWRVSDSDHVFSAIAY